MASITSPLSPADRRPVLSPLLTTEIWADKDRVLVALRGEVDVSTRTLLCDALLQAVAAGPGDVVVDLTEVTFIDAATARIMSTTHRLLLQNGRHFGLRGPSPLAQRVLLVCGVGHLLEIQTGDLPLT